MIYRVKIDGKTFDTKRIEDTYLESDGVLAENSIEYKKFKQNRDFYRNYRYIIKYINNCNDNNKIVVRAIMKNMKDINEIINLYRYFMEKFSLINEDLKNRHYIEVAKRVEHISSNKNPQFLLMFFIAYLDDFFENYFANLSSQNIKEIFNNIFIEPNEDFFPLNVEYGIDEKSKEYKEIWNNRFIISLQNFLESKHLCFDCKNVKKLKCSKVMQIIKSSVELPYNDFITDAVQKVVTKGDETTYKLYNGEFIDVFIVSGCKNFKLERATEDSNDNKIKQKSYKRFRK